jgi:hypothetical protein
VAAVTTLKLAEVIHASGGAILEGPTVDELIAKNMAVVKEWAKLTPAEIRKRGERARDSKALADNCK